MKLSVPLYLRLILVQGGCLLAGFGLFALLQPALPVSTDPELARRAVIGNFAAITASFLTTWGLLAGLTGLIFMREQRQQWIQILNRHCDPEPDDGDEDCGVEIARFPTVDDFSGRPQTIRRVFPEHQELRVAIYRDDEEGSCHSIRSEVGVSRTFRLRSFNGTDSSWSS